MLDRRQDFRGRVYFGGRIAFDDNCSSLDCTIRNFSSTGAKIKIANAPMLTDEVDLTIEQKGLSYRARVIWRRDDEAGLVFYAPHPAPTAKSPDWAIQFRANRNQDLSLK